MNPTDFDTYNAFLRENTFPMLHGEVLEAAHTGVMLTRSLDTTGHYATACSWFTSVAAAEIRFHYQHEIVAHGATIMPQLDGLDAAHRDAIRMISAASNADYATTFDFIKAQIDHVEISATVEAGAHALAVFRAICAYAREFHSRSCDVTRCAYLGTAR